MLVQFLHCQVSQSYIFMLVTNMKGLVSSKGKYCQSDSHYKDFVFPSLNTHSTFNKAEVKHFTARGLDNNIPTFVSKKKKKHTFLITINNSFFPSLIATQITLCIKTRSVCVFIHLNRSTYAHIHIVIHRYMLIYVQNHRFR